MYVLRPLHINKIRLISAVLSNKKVNEPLKESV